ncbi:OmpA family protein [Polyangium sp. 15x6]|uniref:OmpA family protein n=1 Tax=Polyangium sp. 15x6 TaxID=3042687 RepID=UPI00249C4B7D|nr:OmpA family protein [Polyangium sp. 15x6]MDI3283050.1 OmpA family protein [Polyangium sp. 15x6]
MRTSKGHRWLLCAAALGSIAGIAAPASADDLAINRFYPAPAGDRFFGAQSPYVAGELTPHAALIVDYAHNPLVLRRQSDDESLGSVVSNQLYLHLNGSFALFERLLVNVDVPVALYQNGENPTNTLGISSPSGADFGDLRLGLRLRVVGDYDSIFQLGIGGYVWVPTGTGSFVTDGNVRGLPQVIVGGKHDRFVYSVAVGPEIRPDQNYFNNVLLGTTFVAGGGIGFLLGEERNFQIGPEFNIVASMRDTTRQSLNAEALVGAKYRFAENFEAGIAAGPGLASGIGTPDFRVVGSLAYTPKWKAKDTDGDGIVDKEDACVDVKGVKHSDPAKNGCPADRDNDTILDVQDACPDLKGVANADPKKNGCPPDSDDDGIYDDKDACPDVKGVSDPDPARNGCPPDKDKDGIIDAQDACIDVPGVSDPDAKKNGCPPDKDNDGVYDAQDACPDIPGIKTNDPATNGCPGDTDGDTIRDDKDACPNEKGKPDPDPKQNGCPKAVRVTETEVIILQQVQFDTAKATIRKVSDTLLDEVAAVLNEHPELIKVEVQGHTDSRGSKQLNTKLSQARADAVKAALAKRGVSADRMSTMGYGPDRPVGDNATEEGRQANRRVQFVILEKKMKDGSIKKYENVAPPPPPPAAPKGAAPAAPKGAAPAAPKGAAPAPAAPKGAAPAPAAPAPKGAAPAPAAPKKAAPAPTKK